MSLINFFEKCEAKNKIIIKDIKNLSFCEKIRLASLWGIKTNIFNVTKILIKSVANRERNSRKFERKLKQLEKIINERHKK